MKYSKRKLNVLGKNAGTRNKLDENLYEDNPNLYAFESNKIKNWDELKKALNNEFKKLT